MLSPMWAMYCHGGFGHTGGVHFSRPHTSPFFGLFQSFGDYFRAHLKTRMSVRRKRTQTKARNSAFCQISRCFLRFFKQWSPKSRLCLKGLPGREQTKCNLFPQLILCVSELFKSANRLHFFRPFLAVKNVGKFTQKFTCPVKSATVVLCCAIPIPTLIPTWQTEIWTSRSPGTVQHCKSNLHHWVA